MCLREYCVEILASTFNTMIVEGRQLITANGNEKSADMSYLLWAIRFFMEYNRLSDMKLEVIRYVNSAKFIIELVEIRFYNQMTILIN